MLTSPQESRPIHFVAGKKFLRRVRMLCVALRTVPKSPVHSNGVINYAIAIYVYFEQCCVIVSKTFPGTKNYNIVYFGFGRDVALVDNLLQILFIIHYFY